MFYWLGQLWYGIKWLAGLTFPMFARARDYRHWGPYLRWPLHVLILIAILACLTYLNYYFDLEQVLLTPLPFLRKIWLPLLFVLIYINAWLGWWLWQLLGPDREVSDYPDIDAAWSEALQALEREGIELVRVPLFLVLGKSAGAEDALFRAAHLDLPVKHVPRRPDAPLHVYAGPNGIYVTCAATCLTGRQAAILAGEAHAAVPTTAAPGGSETAARIGKAPQVAGPAQGQGSVGMLLLEEETEPGVDPKARPASLLKNSAEVEELTKRFKHLCGRIARDRRPYCSINGILVLLPFGATTSETDATQTGILCQLDLSAARQVLQVDCPVFVLVCDLERVPGCREMVDRLPEDRRDRRIGKRFSYLPQVEATSPAEVVEGGMRWICSGLLPPMVFRLMQVTPTARGGRDDAVRGNMRLYRLLTILRDRQKRLAQLVTRATVASGSGALLLNGCYLGCTGVDTDREQGFIPGVFQQLVETQNFVSWTSEALAEEADYRRWARIGYAALVVFVLAVAALLYFV